MSEKDVQSLSLKLDGIVEVLYPMNERLKDLPEIKKLVQEHEIAIPLLQQEFGSCKKHCEVIQAEKNSKRVNIGSLKGQILGGSILLLLGLIAGYLVK